MHAIATHGLTKDFGQRRGLFDLDLQVPTGRVHGFLGPNGSGKTTCIRLLLDLLRPTRGGARVLGSDPRTHGRRLRARIGYLPGELSLPDHITGRRFLDDSASIRGGVDLAYRQELVDIIGAQLEPKVRTLSKGNKQKLALVDALQHQPELLILDEPTDGLDPLLRHHVHGFLRTHVKTGGTVFLSSHVVHEIQTTCDDVSILIAGRLARRAPVHKLLAAEPVRVEATVEDLASARAMLARVAGVSALRHKDPRIRFDVKGALLEAMQVLIRVKAEDVVIEHDLEETFLRMYKEGG